MLRVQRKGKPVRPRARTRPARGRRPRATAAAGDPSACGGARRNAAPDSRERRRAARDRHAIAARAMSSPALSEGRRGKRLIADHWRASRASLPVVAAPACCARQIAAGTQCAALLAKQAALPLETAPARLTACDRRRLATPAKGSARLGERFVVLTDNAIGRCRPRTRHSLQFLGRSSNAWRAFAVHRHRPLTHVPLEPRQPDELPSPAALGSAQPCRPDDRRGYRTTARCP